MNRNRILFWNLVEPEHARAQAFCRRLAGSRDDGDDLYQDSLVKALTAFGRLRDHQAFRPWLYRIIVNQFKKGVRTLLETELAAGMHSVQWDATGEGSKMVASGVYFYRPTAGDFSDSKKMTLLK